MAYTLFPDPSWAAQVPTEQIPATLSALAALQVGLAARLLLERAVPVEAATAEVPVDAKEMARLFNVHESWVRTEQRARRIPFLQVGRYVRFRPKEVEAAIAEQQPARGWVRKRPGKSCMRLPSGKT